MLKGAAAPDETVMLVSDGCGTLMLSSDKSQIFDSVSILSEWFWEVSEEEMCEILKQNLEIVFSKKSNDDLSIIMIQKVKEDENGLQ